MDSTDQQPISQTSGEDGLREAMGNVSQRSHMLSALQLMVESHLLISMTDLAGQIIYANDRFCEISKYAREELIGQSHRIVRSDAHEPAFFEKMWSNLRTGRTWTGTIENKAKDGSPFWVQSTISPLHNSDSEIVGYVAILTDVSAQHLQATAEVQDAQQKLKTLETAFDCLESSLCVLGPDGYVHFANKAQQKMYPDSAAQVGSVVDLKDITRRRRPDLSDDEAQALVDEFLAHDTEEKRRLADGRTIQVSRTVTPEGYVIGLHTDVSELVAQTELLEAQAAAMNLMKAIAADANGSKEAEVAYANCLKRICRFTGWEIGHVYLPASDGSDKIKPTESWHFSDDQRFEPFRKATERTHFDPGVGLPGRVFARGEPVWLRDVTADPNFPRAEAARQSGIVGGCAFPVRAGDKIVAVLEFYSSAPIIPNPTLEEVLSHVCTQMGRVAERDQAERRLMKRVAAELKQWDRRLIEQNERFNAAVENMSQGLCMFDADERLIVCNERYAALYGLTAELVKPGTTLGEIVRHRINNGLYAGSSPEAYIKERQDWAQTKSIERTLHHLSDGRVIAVSKRPLPGGGWVSTHEDITDRYKAQKALQQSREMSSKAFRSSPAAMAISDMTDGSYLDVNETWTTLLGHSHAEAMASSAMGLSIWIDSKARERFLEQVNTMGSVRSFETRFRAKNGDILDVLVSGERLELDGASRLLASATDITERKRAEKALRESQELSSKAFRASPAAMAISNMSDGSHLDINETWTTMLGYSHEEAMAHSAVELGVWANSNCRDEFVEQIRREGSVKGLETKFRAKDGKLLDVLVSGEHLDIDGEPRLLVASHDITERKRAEAALRQSQELFSKAYQLTPFALSISSVEDSSYHTVNDAWVKILGYSRAEATASSALDLGIWADPNDRKRFIDQLKKNGGSLRDFETKFKTKSGRELDVLTYGEYVEVDGKPLLLFVVHDITERKRAEKALVESQELFQKAFQLSPVALAISTPEDGLYFDVNDTWMEMFGYSREEARESTSLQLGIWTNPNDREHLRTQMQTLGGSVREFETTQRKKDGTLLNVLINCCYVEVHGEMLLFFAIHDITERKRGEQALKDSEQRFKALIETLNVVPWRFDPKEMRFTYVGPQAEDVFGYPIEDWYHPNFWTNSIHPDDREKTIQICADATERCEDHDFEYRMLKADGGDLWVRDVVSVFVEDGQVVELRGILIDISDRKRAELALRDSELRFKDIAEISSDWIWECDEELRFTYFSERFFEITGVPTKDLLGKTRIEVGRKADADWSQHIADLEARRAFRDFRYSIKTEAGRRYWTVSGRPVFDESGTFKGYRGTGADLTSEVEAEQELIRHRDHLQELVNEATAELKARAEELHQALEKEKELNALQRQFVSMASHEFRTPLAIIDSAAQRLRRNADKANPADVTKRVEKIRNAVGRMTRLMESTLIAARLDAGRPTLQIDDCDVSALIRETCARQQEIAETHRISCEIRDLPPTVKADPLALEQVFTNLLSNAVKYSPECPDIRVKATAASGEVVIRVQDQGVGIDQDEVPKMFQRFFRARTSAGIAGTGIGLNLVKTLVELHGGSVEVESRKGEGSLFIIRLPVEGPGAAKDGETQAA